MERFLVVLKSHKRMNVELENILLENATLLNLQKDDVLKTPEQNVDNLYFIEKGLLRYYHQKGDRQETLRFKKEDEFIMANNTDESLRNVGIDALEESLLWSFPGPFVKELTKTDHTFCLQYLGILGKEHESISIASYCSLPGKTAHNYEALRQHSPELLRRVPIPYLADYTQIPEKMFRHLHAGKTSLFLSISRKKREKK